ncbi:hypothetical protein QWY20_16965 [Alkalimonas sp. MEB108]|uniref:Uncharacterized protein n=1 Tax=Alkalimonas cellulosilytica TaxID=3058395 RepID=A0ABU7J9I5_9GAMM|nr:hypothetical protein [Alkalimonas sp. MEB108]MEE2003147.1 hypothetical protein [Alkalimonas sp. MEB108]
MKKCGGVLTDWFQYQVDSGDSVIFGTVIEDPNRRFFRGQSIVTSTVISIDRERGIAETMYSVYKLMAENSTDENVRHKFSLSYGGARFHADMNCIVRDPKGLHCMA